jgi:flagellar biosynthetic protein FliR
VFNPALAMQSPLTSAFLGIAGVTLIFITGLDHFLLRSLAGLYDAFPPAGTLMPGDMVQVVVKGISRSFETGIALGMPFLVMGLLLNVALGVMQKIMPQVQLFLIVMPVQIWGGLFLLALTMAGILTVWLHFADASVNSFFGR